MRTFAIIAVLVMAVSVGAQQTPPAQAAGATAAPAASQAPAADVPDGTLALVELKSKLDTKKVRLGDPVKLEVTQDAKSPDGKVVLPKGTKLSGKVTEVDPSTKESPDAKLSFVVTSAEVKGKPLAMTGYMIPPFKAPAPMQAMDRSFIDAGNTRSDTGYQTKEDPTAGKASGGQDASGLEGIKLKLDPKLGTYLVADKRNIVLESGTMFHVKQATLQPQATK